MGRDTLELPPAHGAGNEDNREGDSIDPKPDFAADEEADAAVQREQRDPVGPWIPCVHLTAQRQLGFANPAKRFFLSLRQLPETDPWRQCAAIEEWLDKPGDAPPAN